MISGPSYLDRVSTYKPGASVEDIKREYGIDSVEKLASNENPYGPSPLALEAATKALVHASIYPDGGLHLRQALADFHNVDVLNITVNNGSDAIIHQIMRTFLLPGETALSSRGGFVSFGIAVKLIGHEPQFVELGPGYRFDVEAIASAITKQTKVVYIPNPNNPTGTFIPTTELNWLLDRIPDSTLVVMDEAYAEYAKHLNPETYPDTIVDSRPNIITLRTFSKAYGLASLRVGYAVGDKNVIRWLLKTKLPFDPSGPASAAAIAALSDIEFVNKTLGTNKAGLELLSKTLIESGYTIAESTANFIMIDCGSIDGAETLHRSLLQHGFISRPLAGFDLPTCVRVSTGTMEQNQRLSASFVKLAEVVAAQ